MNVWISCLRLPDKASLLEASRMRKLGRYKIIPSVRAGIFLTLKVKLLIRKQKNKVIKIKGLFNCLTFKIYHLETQESEYT